MDDRWEMFLFAALLIAIGGVPIAIGAGLIRFRARKPRGGAWIILAVAARLLICLGAFFIGYLFLNHIIGFYGPGGKACFYEPSFYLVTTVLFGAAIWWFRRWRHSTAPRRTLSFLGYPVMLAALIALAGYLATRAQQSSSDALEAAIDAATGKPAPDFAFFDLNGTVHHLAEFRGQVVLLNFWDTACGPCIEGMPRLSKLQEKFAKQGLVLCFLSGNSARELDQFFREHNCAGWHGRLGKELPVPEFYQSGKAWPINFLIDRTGVVRSAMLGDLPPPLLEKEIEKAL